ncbi:MAG: geranylgeranylglycerol-phosphate geranylgeranyltransferase [bacterium]|nr:geranylgeranylglycerol-phosphate geranylgeranyltransferase [bacterium]
MNSRPKIFSIRGILRISRVPNLIIIGLTQYLTAIFLVGATRDWLTTMTDWRLFLVVVSTLLISSAGYIINDYYDQKIDMVNRPEKVVVGTDLRRRAAMFYHTGFNFLGIALGLAAYPKIGLIHFCSAFLLWLYSNQLRRMPLIGNLLIAALTALAILVISLYYQATDLLILVYCLFAGSIMLMREIIKDIEDLKGEEQFGVKSLPVLIGIRKTKRILYIIAGLAAIGLISFLVKVNNDIVEWYFILVSPFLIFFLYKLYRADTKLHFTRLKYYSNLIILSGIISMTFF